MAPKRPWLDLDAPRTQGRHDVGDERLGHRPGRCRTPRGTTALPGVGVERELADDEDGRPRVVRLCSSRRIRSSAIFRAIRSTCVRPVVVGHAHEGEQPRPVDRPTTSPSTSTRALRDSLEHRSHGGRLRRRPRRRRRRAPVAEHRLVLERGEASSLVDTDPAEHRGEQPLRARDPPSATLTATPRPSASPTA